MKLGAKITSERGKAVTKTANEQLVTTINIDGVETGRVVARYEQLNSNEVTIYYYPIGGSGRTLLHKSNGNLKHGKMCSICEKNPVKGIGQYCKYCSQDIPM